MQRPWRRQPLTRARPAQEIDGRAIERLVKDGVLKEVTGRYRDRVYEAKEVLLALDAFAARGGRRTRGTAATGQ